MSAALLTTGLFLEPKAGWLLGFRTGWRKSLKGTKRWRSFPHAGLFLPLAGGASAPLCPLHSLILSARGWWLYH